MSVVSTPIRSRSGSDLSGAMPPPRKFLNGWTKQQEELMAEWSDKAGCYRWLHDRCEKKYSRLNMFITIPVIILSTLTGTANFAIDGFVPSGDDELKKFVSAGIGGVSIFAAILTTLGNFLRFAQGSESHRVAGIAWGKFQRQIAVELAINPNDRLDCMDFLKICRAELDRLIEQSPAIPEDIIREFEHNFKDKKEIKKPEICNGMEHTKVFRDNGSQLRQLTSEAALTLLHKKKLLRNEIVPDLKTLIQKELTERLADLSGSVVYAHKKADDDFSFINPLHKRTVSKAEAAFVDWKPKKSEGTSTPPLSDIHIEVVGAPSRMPDS
jgi:hypothetical protein